jgi:hypothetical protein
MKGNVTKDVSIIDHLQLHLDRPDRHQGKDAPGRASLRKYEGFNKKEY